MSRRGFWRELQEAVLALLLLVILAIVVASVYLGAIWLVAECTNQ